jgi:hypothetical protein
MYFYTDQNRMYAFGDLMIQWFVSGSYANFNISHGKSVKNSGFSE